MSPSIQGAHSLDSAEFAPEQEPLISLSKLPTPMFGRFGLDGLPLATCGIRPFPPSSEQPSAFPPKSR